MLDIQIEYTSPEIRQDFTDVMEQIESIMYQSIQINLSSGGRPPFQVKHGHQPLMISGRMFRGVMGTHDNQSATVYMDSSVVSKNGFFYPQALNDGAVIPPVEGKLMVFEIDGHVIFTYHRKGFKLGAFPFMIFQEEDKEKILQLYGNAIFLTPKTITA